MIGKWHSHSNKSIVFSQSLCRFFFTLAHYFEAQAIFLFSLHSSHVWRCNDRQHYFRVDSLMRARRIVDFANKSGVIMKQSKATYVLVLCEILSQFHWTKDEKKCIFFDQFEDGLKIQFNSFDWWKFVLWCDRARKRERKKEKKKIMPRVAAHQL